jgi:hypothetical protein
VHGIIFYELQSYVGDRLGPDAWPILLADAGLRGKLYLATDEYPDEDIVALVQTAARSTKQDPGAILEDFGEFLGPSLLKRYRAVLRAEWRTLDLLENAEKTIHKTVRLWNPEASPPRLRCRRTSPTEVWISYNSPRKLCQVAKGLGKGIATHFGEEVSIEETSCMLNGARSCELRFELAPVASQAPSNFARA